MKKNLIPLLIALAVMANPAFCQLSADNADINTYSLAVSSGQKASFRFPKDIRSGDRITGTVVEEIKASSAGNNTSSSRLEGVVIEIEGKQTKLSNKLVSFIVPAGIASIPFLLKNAAGQVLDRGQIPVGGPMYDLLSDLWWREPLGGLYAMAPVAQPGQTFKVTGPFDGNASNTNITISNIPCEIITESNTGCVVAMPPNAATGAANIYIEEGENKEAHKVNVAEINLTANKTSLQRGGKATVKTMISGLKGLSNSSIKITLTNKSPETISFKNESNIVINRTINPSEVKNGVYEFSTKIIALNTGTYTIGANIAQPDDGGNPCVREYLDCNKAADDAYDAQAKICKDSSNGDAMAAAACLAPYEQVRDAAKEKCLKKFRECK